MSTKENGKPKVRVKQKKGKVKIKKQAIVIKNCDQLRGEFKDIKSIDMENPEHRQFLKCMADDNRVQLGEGSKKIWVSLPFFRRS